MSRIRVYDVKFSKTHFLKIMLKREMKRKEKGHKFERGTIHGSVWSQRQFDY